MSAILIDLPNRRTYVQMDIQTDTVAYRDARTHLKRWKIAKMKLLVEISVELKVVG